MSKIIRIEPVLLSAPYAHPNSSEVRARLKSGYRTCGLVEVELDNGMVGWGEGYLAVFAPRVFEEIVRLIEPHLKGCDAGDVNHCYHKACSVINYWSVQGAARHVVSAIEMALIDAMGKTLKVPAYQLLGGKAVETIRLYGSGGDSLSPAMMANEIELLAGMGIDLFKMRARHHEIEKTVWTMNAAAKSDIAVGVDMVQNLVVAAEPVAAVVRYVQEVHERSGLSIAFLEEALGLHDRGSYPRLRAKLDVPVCGGETCTTAEELCGLIEQNAFDFVQPDASVIGGMHQVMRVASHAQQHGMDTVVHAWGGGVCLMANYHAAFAAGSRLAEWPMPKFALRESLLVEPLQIVDGKLSAPTCAGLGVLVSDAIKQQYPFREDAVYDCAAFAVVPDADVWSS